MPRGPRSPRGRAPRARDRERLKEMIRYSPKWVALEILFPGVMALRLRIETFINNECEQLSSCVLDCGI